MSQRTFRFQEGRQSFRSSTVSLQGVSTAGVQAAGSEIALIGSLADSTREALVSQARRSAKAADDLYIKDAEQDIKLNLSQIKLDTPNPKEMFEKSLAYLDGVVSNAPEQYQQRLALIGKSFTTTNYISNSGDYSKALKDSSSSAMEAYAQQIEKELSGVALVSPESQELFLTLDSELKDIYQRQATNYLLDTGIDDPKQVQRIRDMYLAKYVEASDRVKTSQLADVIAASDDILFASNVAEGKTGVKEVDSLPFELRQKALDKSASARNASMQANAEQEKIRKKQLKKAKLSKLKQYEEASLESLSNPTFAQYQKREEIERQYIELAEDDDDYLKLQERRLSVANMPLRTDPVMFETLMLAASEGQTAFVEEYINSVGAGINADARKELQNELKKFQEGVYSSPAFRSARERLVTELGIQAGSGLLTLAFSGGMASMTDDEKRELFANSLSGEKTGSKALLFEGLRMLQDYTVNVLSEEKEAQPGMTTDQLINRYTNEIVLPAIRNAKDKELSQVPIHLKRVGQIAENYKSAASLLDAVKAGDVDMGGMSREDKFVLMRVIAKKQEALNVK